MSLNTLNRYKYTRAAIAQAVNFEDWEWCKS